MSMTAPGPSNGSRSALGAVATPVEPVAGVPVNWWARPGSGDARAVDEDVDGLPRELIELDDRARAQREHLADRHARSTELDADVEVYVEQQVDARALSADIIAGQRAELDQLDRLIARDGWAV